MVSEAVKDWPAKKVRQSFLDYFAQRGHTIVPSSSLVPGNDPTLLFTNAGMVQFKDVFLGIGSRPYTRAADSQKCMRVAGKHNDLDDVGRDDTHHTFFEMLGNWSFGDYYKREAITWAWDLLTRVWGLPKDRLWATCFEDELGEIERDDEAAEIWYEQPGFPADHVLFFGREENFWEMAETGPCGPDSEIHLDLGEERCNRRHEPGHVCQVNGDCSRFLELWNLVFIQYNRVDAHTLEPLPAKHVDTGMGLERIVSVLQGVDSNYKTDLFTPMMDRIQQLAGHSAAERESMLTPYRVIADHSRAAAFLIADGVVPGNTSRNYVCRMVIRRASRFGTQLGFSEPFLAEIAKVVIDTYGDVYPELERNREAILSTITDEEQRFHHTLEAGMAQLESRLARLEDEGRDSLPGEEAFELYATYGLPLEITRDIAREHGLQVDERGFHQAMEAHRVASGAGRALGAAEGEGAEVYRRLLARLKEGEQLPQGRVEHDPYHGLEVEGPLLAIVRRGQEIEQAQPGEEVALVLPRSCFYVEAGGQVSDQGTVVSAAEPRWEVDIVDVSEPVEGLIVHHGVVRQGNPKVGDTAIAAVNASRRWDIMRNHTATHLLQAALRAVLGTHVRQAGSLVAPDRLRFDFTHRQALSEREIQRVEDFVNQAILANYELQAQIKPLREAVSEGATALFGESYGEKVRTIAIGGPERISYELCGGTHVPNTGLIGAFMIVSESSAAAGIRRIEAVTGREAARRARRYRDQLKSLAAELNVPLEEVPARVQALLQEREALAHQVHELQVELGRQTFASLQPGQVEGVAVMTGVIPAVDIEALRQFTDQFRAQYRSGVIVLGAVHNGRPLLVAAVTEDLVARGLNAVDLVRTVARQVGGGGGGKATLAQAGGKDPAKLEQALGAVVPWVREHLRPVA